MSHRLTRLLVIALLVASLTAPATTPVQAATQAEVTELATGLAATAVAPLPPCVAFSPYVEGFDPDQNVHPSAALIDTLLDNLLRQSTFNCIQSYGVLNGLDHTVAAAAQRGLTVVQIIWLDGDTADDASIAKGIEVARAYPHTIVRLSCGSEVRLRHGLGFTQPIANCIARLRAANVTQPIGTIESWYWLCNQQQPCQQAALADQLDWIGVNVHAWYENRDSGLYPCVTASDAPAFAVARLQEVASVYPGKLATLTEFGWPSGPNGYSETNSRTGQHCGVASEANQALVVSNTRGLLTADGLEGVVFEAYNGGAWKARAEASPVGSYWGLCSGTSPYGCNSTAVDCRTLPNRGLVVTLDAPGRLKVVVTTAGGGLRELRIGDPSQRPASPINALVDIPGSVVGARGAFTYTPQTPNRQVTFYLRQAQAGAAVHIPLVLVEACRSWPLFVGAGPSAFSPSGSNQAPIPRHAASVLDAVPPTSGPAPVPASAPAIPRAGDGPVTLPNYSSRR